MGSNLSKYLVEHGAKLIGVSEKDYGIYNPKGINPEDLIAFRAKNKTLINFPGAESVKDESVMFKECDIFIPAVLEFTINSKNADLFRCKLVAEVATAAISTKGEEVLKKKKIAILPDLLMEGGGITASYFEWLKNLEHVRIGRTTKRWEEYSKMNILEALRVSTGLKVNLNAPGCS
jgi:glutamate dehydrogenase (NAD(P)+)